MLLLSSISFGLQHVKFNVWPGSNKQFVNINSATKETVWSYGLIKNLFCSTFKWAMFLSFLNKILLMNSWWRLGYLDPLFDKESLSLNDNISLTQPCYIQNFFAEAFVWTYAMFKIYRYLLKCFCQQFLYGANRFIECRPELSEPKYTRNTRREIRVNCVRTNASMRLSWQVYASALK